MIDNSLVEGEPAVAVSVDLAKQLDKAYEELGVSEVLERRPGHDLGILRLRLIPNETPYAAATDLGVTQTTPR